MPDPITALGWFSALCLLTGVLFWPRSGVLPRAIRAIRLTDRVLVEDALKHLHNREYHRRNGTLDGLAGALQISRGRAADLVTRLQSMGLIRTKGLELPLTESGREYALRIIRSHRLWETYLASETSVPAPRWHDQAEIREHSLSDAAADELAAQMGNPRFDPHGDPIPTSTGELPPPSGVPLSSLGAGDGGVITHLEDEPEQVYDRLVQTGLALEMTVHVLETSATEIRFQANGIEIGLEPVVATNVTVKPLPDSKTRKPTPVLADLGPGQSAKVRRILPTLQGVQRRRLLDLGVVPNTAVTAEFSGAMNGPTAYRIRGTLIALRRSQAEAVEIIPADGLEN
ncbi:MAG: metal-dependent transcriptional regulator [Gemmatimonadota bacterium]|nr:metal-dependent transcriptional regulator [Gemmatimonadota bacterium]